MDEMHISGNLFNMLVEKAIKLWIKKNAGFEPKFMVQNLVIDLKDDKFSIEFKAKGSLSEVDRHNLLNKFIFSKERGA